MIFSGEVPRPHPNEVAPRLQTGARYWVGAGSYFLMVLEETLPFGHVCAMRWSHTPPRRPFVTRTRFTVNLKSVIHPRAKSGDEARRHVRTPRAPHTLMIDVFYSRENM